MSTNRLLHTMLRVGNLQRAIDFYVNSLGMRHLRTCDIPMEEYTLAFVGYGTEMEGSVIELTYNYGVEKYDIGKGYGHICIEVDDVPAQVAKCRANGVKVIYVSEPEGAEGEEKAVFMAFVEDPDGYQVEMLNRKLFRKTCSK